MADKSQNSAEFDPGADDVFARIAGRYDRLCDVFSLFIHRHWKRHMALAIAAHDGRAILDVASGTGDIPLRVLKALDRGSPGLRDRTIIASDVCPQMLAIAKGKPRLADSRVRFSVLDAYALREIETGSIDLFSISFGMKIMDREQVLAEARRVLKPGGWLFCLEAAQIKPFWLHRAYLGYMSVCMPLIGMIATRGDRSAYDYLLRGVNEFPAQETFCDELRNSGFENVSFRNLSLGIVALHRAQRIPDA